MLTDRQKNALLAKLIELIELPAYAYEKAKARYDDIGEYLSQDGSESGAYEPHITPQGSFRLGTANRPIDDREEYDLDLTCKLRAGVTTATHTQAQVKALVGRDIKSYRKARSIDAPVDEKKRCWRLEYADKLSFHIDIVPCIPTSVGEQLALTGRIAGSGVRAPLATTIAAHATSITDNTHPLYNMYVDDWYTSNPEGYARWFEAQMATSSAFGIRASEQQDDLPIWSRKTPLQQCVQILKRHRDVMFKNNNAIKPISAIITTLAGHAYNGEPDLVRALGSIIRGLNDFAASGSNEVFNPAHPDENLAEKWTTPEHAHLHLRENFVRWTTQVTADVSALLTAADMNFASGHLGGRFAVTASANLLADELGIGLAPAIHTIKHHELEVGENKPWRNQRGDD